MTLRELYTAIEGVAQSVPDVRTIIENDILKLNTMRKAEYSVFGITQESHTSSDGWMSFTLNLFFIDRLLNAGDNELEVQSHAIEVLRAILMRVGELVEVGEVRYTTFTQRFQDLCAGAWAVVTIRTPESDCNEIFNED